MQICYFVLSFMVLMESFQILKCIFQKNCCPYLDQVSTHELDRSGPADSLASLLIQFKTVEENCHEHISLLLTALSSIQKISPLRSADEPCCQTIYQERRMSNDMTKLPRTQLNASSPNRKTQNAVRSTHHTTGLR